MELNHNLSTSMANNNDLWNLINKCCAVVNLQPAEVRPALQFMFSIFIHTSVISLYAKAILYNIQIKDTTPIMFTVAIFY